ncbi:bifunctional glutamate N-acetyltransferase/amino-acid acetyltransferase ArgJ [Dehalococcoidia bacterium]|nr:bifunctional glutamate N-acetyltransferase/amino-acid acetyltransferase ArgJ [Dehalococcoidia bacterium]
MIELIQNGSVTSARGFLAGGIHAGIKTSGEDALDLGILFSEHEATVAGTYTTNKVISPSVKLTKSRASKQTAQGVVVNSGCANCCVGDVGLKDAEEMTSLAADHVNASQENMLVASTGMIGVELPMALVRQNIGNIEVTSNGGHDFARTIMTTDTHPKELAVSVDIDGTKIVFGGAAKGVGMIHPNMATMLAFIATDAKVEPGFLDQSLRKAVDLSFNMIDVDGDQSTNDTVLVLANAAAGGNVIEKGSKEARAFQDGLDYVCTELAKELVRDGEGAQRLLEVTLYGAHNLADARTAARTIASSLLVKSMVHGRDPNWGRIMMGLGKSGIKFDESNVDIFINEIHIVHQGVAIPYLKDAVVSAMSVPEVKLTVNVGAGDSSATAWGCDLTEEYVTFNSAYST